MVSNYAAVLQPLLAHGGGLASELQASAFVTLLQQGFNTPLSRCLACTILQLTPAVTCGALLDAGLLPMLTAWLRAAVQLQHHNAHLLLQQLLPVLQRLPVDKESVKDSGAGKWLQALARPHQPPHLQTAAQAVKAAWLQSVKSNPTRIHLTGAPQKRTAGSRDEALEGARKRPRGSTVEATKRVAVDPSTFAAGGTAVSPSSTTPQGGPSSTPALNQQPAAEPAMDVPMYDMHTAAGEQQDATQLTAAPPAAAGDVSMIQQWHCEVPAAGSAVAAAPPAAAVVEVTRTVEHSPAGSLDDPSHAASAAADTGAACLETIPSAQQQPSPLRLVKCTLQLSGLQQGAGCAIQHPPGSFSNSEPGEDGRLVLLHVEVLPQAATDQQPGATGMAAAASCATACAEQPGGGTGGSRMDITAQATKGTCSSETAAAAAAADAGSGQLSPQGRRQQGQIPEEPAKPPDQQTQQQQEQQQMVIVAEEQGEQQQEQLPHRPSLDPRRLLLERQRQQAAVAHFRHQVQAMQARHAWMPPPRAPPLDPSWQVAAGEGSSEGLRVPTDPAAAAAAAGGVSASSQPGPQISPSSPRHPGAYPAGTSATPTGEAGDARCPVMVPWTSQQSEAKLAAATARLHSSRQQWVVQNVASPATQGPPTWRHHAQQQHHQHQQQQQHLTKEPLRLLGPGMLIKPCFPGAAASGTPAAAADSMQAMRAVRGSSGPAAAPAAAAPPAPQQQPLEVMRMLQDLMASGALPRMPPSAAHGMSLGAAGAGRPASSLGSAAAGGASQGAPVGIIPPGLGAGVGVPATEAAAWRAVSGGHGMGPPIGPGAAPLAPIGAAAAATPALPQWARMHVVDAAGRGCVPVASVLVPPGVAPLGSVMGMAGSTPLYAVSGYPQQAHAAVAWPVEAAPPAGQQPSVAPSHLHSGAAPGVGTAHVPAVQLPHPAAMQHDMHHVGRQQR